MHTRPNAHCYTLQCSAAMRPLHVAAIRENDDETQGLDITYISGLAQPHTIHTCACHRPPNTPMQCSAFFPLQQQHNTLCSTSKPLAKYFFLNLFVMMQLNWKLKAISFIFHSQQETYFFFLFISPFIYLYILCISLTYILSLYFLW